MVVLIAFILFLKQESGIKCHAVPDSVRGFRFSSRFSSRFDKLDNSCIITGTKNYTMLFDISTTEMQYFHHKIKSVSCNFPDFQKNSKYMLLSSLVNHNIKY